MAKTAKSNGNGTRLVATDSRPKPGDFPLGSLESRAAARAMLQMSRQLSSYDADCLTICCMIPYIHAGVDPDYQVLGATEVYKRGEQLHDRLYGPVVPSHLDPEDKRRTMASIFFDDINGRQPAPGDVLRYEQIAEIYCGEGFKQKIERFEQAWARRLTNLPCPLKFENGRLYCRSADSKPKGAWVENDIGDPRFWWSDIEAAALGNPGRERTEFAPDWRPAISAVVFVESEDGKRRAEPLEV